MPSAEPLSSADGRAHRTNHRGATGPGHRSAAFVLTVLQQLVDKRSGSAPVRSDTDNALRDKSSRRQFLQCGGTGMTSAPKSARDQAMDNRHRGCCSFVAGRFDIGQIGSRVEKSERCPRQSRQISGRCWLSAHPDNQAGPFVHSAADMPGEPGFRGSGDLSD